MVVQERLADDISGALAYQSRNQILTTLIAKALVQIQFLSELKESTVQSVIFEQTLKIVVQLTFCKPWVDKETRSMNIKQYFVLDFATMIQLKDYLKNKLSLVQCKSVDLKRKRKVVVSLTTIMCEFDTLSEEGEVLADIYSVIETTFIELKSAQS